MKNTLLLLIFGLFATTSVQAQPTANVSVDTNIRYQVISGWEGTACVGQDHPDFAKFAPKLPELFDSIVHELGINRLRVEVRSGTENVRDYWREYRDGLIDSATWECLRYSTINDNNDSRSIDWSGFQFAELDSTIKLIVLPIKQRLEAKGEKLFLNVCYTSFTLQMEEPQCSDTLDYLHANEAHEYAEFVLATYLHLRDTWGLVPDGWEVVLGPDQTKEWMATRMIRAIDSTAARLLENGFTPRFIAPSAYGIMNSVGYFDNLAAVPSVLANIEELSYLRSSDANLEMIGDRAKQYGVKTAMLGSIGANYAVLHNDLAVGMNSAWAQHTLAGPAGNDDGSAYYLINFADTALTFAPASRTHAIMQYFRYIRNGDRRVEAISSLASVQPLAFVTPDGFRKYVVKIDGPATINFTNIPGGRYEASFNPAGESGAQIIDPFDLEQGTTMTALVPDPGVFTVIQRTKAIASVKKEDVRQPLRIVQTSPLSVSVNVPRPDVLEVFDVLGRRLYSFAVDTTTSTLVLPMLGKGAYTIRLAGHPASTIKVAQ